MELKAIQLTKQYGSKTAVNHLNLSLSNGVYGLLGANGAGKTTLMRLLCDIQTPTSGKITLDGKNISVLGEKYRNLLGYLPQTKGGHKNRDFVYTLPTLNTSFCLAAYIGRTYLPK